MTEIIAGDLVKKRVGHNGFIDVKFVDEPVFPDTSIGVLFRVNIDLAFPDRLHNVPKISNL